MIPTNITKEAILKAIEQADCEGVPKGRDARSYHIYYGGKLYPPKYIISLANRFINGYELSPGNFGGGAEANNYLCKLGFDVVPAPAKTDEITDLTVATITLESSQSSSVSNQQRTHLLETVLSAYTSIDILLFPAGYFYLRKHSPRHMQSIADTISKKLKQLHSSATVCFGIDCNMSVDQLAIAVSQTGICAMGRKFYPTDTEKGAIRAAESYKTSEMGHSRFFEVRGKRIYLAVCYDCFGIRHLNIPNPGVDAVLDLAHRFCKRGEGPSGDVDFARKGFAGASQQWNCPVFGTAVFFDRPIPQNWPTGVLWSSSGKSPRHFKYQDNKLHWHSRKEILGQESVLCYEYILP